MTLTMQQKKKSKPKPTEIYRAPQPMADQIRAAGFEANGRGHFRHNGQTLQINDAWLTVSSPMRKDADDNGEVEKEVFANLLQHPGPWRLDRKSVV